ncbi:hypothetical protein [Nitratireductor sp.]|uniref:hypothetical protein n=1 Tax=Nitratireductor sp. TaxID=1872084 RepID=UPI0026256D56|nr:hypothetical protein [Nitratireductor sp.]MCV0381792.1 hypothetical protein [Nitratireductor sp.]
MPAKPLTDHYSIEVLLDEMAQQGHSSAEVDILMVRQGPVDLDLLQDCKRNHPFFGPKLIMKERIKRLRLKLQG